MSQEMTASEQSATNTGIETLKTTSRSVAQRISQVTEANSSLYESYQGQDGQKAYQLIAQWIDLASVLQLNLDEMTMKLEETRQGYDAQQMESQEELTTATKTQSWVFDSLSG